MTKKYFVLILFNLMGLVLLLCPFVGISQELKIFELSDFDLTGNVQSCQVITDYGREEFNFNEDGLLTKSITRYSESDYDVIQYKYELNELVEKRVENYRDGKFDKQTSMAHLYEIDSTNNKKITEKIISYSKEFLGQYEYVYNEENVLVGINQVNNAGIDETTITYSDYKGEYTVTYLLNDVVQKSIRTSKKKAKDNTEQKIVLTKIYLDGTPQKATEQVFAIDDKLILKTVFVYSETEKQFVPEETKTYSYNEAGMLSSEKTKTKNTEFIKEYIYQYDANDNGNWIKKIITPDNVYTTRKIKYYEARDEIEEEE